MKLKNSNPHLHYVAVTAKEASKYDFISGIYEEIVMADKLRKGADPKRVKFKPRKYEN